MQEVDSAWQAEAERLRAEGLLSLPDHEFARWRNTSAGLIAARARVDELLAAAQPRLEALHKQVQLPGCMLAVAVWPWQRQQCRQVSTGRQRLPLNMLWSPAYGEQPSLIHQVWCMGKLGGTVQVQADLAKMQQLEQGLNDRFQPQLAQLQEQTVQLAELRQSLTEAEGNGVSLRRCTANLAQV